MAKKLIWEEFEGKLPQEDKYYPYWISNNNRFSITPSITHKTSVLIKLLASIDEFYVLYDNEYDDKKTKKWTFAPTFKIAIELAENRIN